MKHLDAVAGEFERSQRLARARRDRRLDLLRRYPQSQPIEIEPVELLRIVLDRPIAACSDVGNDGADCRLDIGRGFALGVEKRAKALRKICRAGVEADRHAAVLFAAGEA